MKMWGIVTFALALAVLPLPLASPQLGTMVPSLADAPKTIYLIRHAEKLTDGREDLSAEGFARAKELPRLFLAVPDKPARTLLPRPDAIFATAHSVHSNRPFETVQPLAAALGVQVDTSIANEDNALLAKKLLGGAYRGKIVLVSWHHGTLPALTRALGAVPPYIWPDTQFDRIWRIDYVGGKAKLTDLPQALMPGDSAR